MRLRLASLMVLAPGLLRSQSRELASADVSVVDVRNESVAGNQTLIVPGSRVAQMRS